MILFRDVAEIAEYVAFDGSRHDVEACGFVLAIQDRGFAFIRLENHADDPSIAFKLSGKDLTAWALFEALKLEVVLFHAHLVGPPHPSSADRRYAREGGRHLIYSIEHQQLALFTFEANDDERIRGRLRPREEPIELVDVRTLPDAAPSR